MEYFSGATGVLKLISLLIAALMLFIVFLYSTSLFKKQRILRRFNYWLTSDNVVFLDTETTGFKKRDEIIEIGIINNKGDVLLDQRVMPISSIPLEATNIHGITKRKLKEQNAPSWAEIYNAVQAVLKNKVVVIYNAEFDVRMLHQTCDKHNCPMIGFDYECAMTEYSNLRAEPNRNPRYKDYKWHKLSAAARYEGIKVKQTHNAIDDCLLTLELSKAVIKNYN